MKGWRNQAPAPAQADALTADALARIRETARLPPRGCGASCGRRRGRKRYALRMEPVFGQIKQGRGFRQFPLRTLRPWKQRVLTTGRNALPEGREKDGSRCLNLLVRRTEDPREYAVPTSPKYAQAQKTGVRGSAPPLTPSQQRHILPTPCRDGHSRMTAPRAEIPRAAQHAT